jgi:CRISPR-associated exonuclease Cas4
MHAILFGIFLPILAATVLALWLSRLLRLKAGLPLRARIVYSDTGAWKKVERPLFSSRYLLTGKPDYIVDVGDGRIPIEVKPNREAEEPWIPDVVQLAAYGLLLEETFGAWPPYGLLKYRVPTFRVEFTPELHAQVVEVMREMRSDLTAEDVARSHAEAQRCHACGYRAECGQAIF